MSKLHPYGSTEYSMNPESLKSLGVNIDEQCRACGNIPKNDYFVDHGLIHCLKCALKHGHISKKDYYEHGGE